MEEKLIKLKKQLDRYEKLLAKEMIGYKGVQHESAVSEIKHNKVMVLRAMVDELKQLIEKVERKNRAV